jgi:hypothetical protein
MLNTSLLPFRKTAPYVLIIPPGGKPTTVICPPIEKGCFPEILKVTELVNEL